MLSLLLAILGGAAGLIATAGVVYAAWTIVTYRRDREKKAELAHQESDPANLQENGSVPAYPAALLRWTLLDQIVVGLFILGALLLLTNLIAVIRDRASYPEYQYAYLLCGVVFALLAVSILLLRLFMLLQALKERTKL